MIDLIRREIFLDVHCSDGGGKLLSCVRKNGDMFRRNISYFPFQKEADPNFYVSGQPVLKIIPNHSLDS
jgi:hypothetical protein